MQIFANLGLAIKVQLYSVSIKNKKVLNKIYPFSKCIVHYNTIHK